MRESRYVVSIGLAAITIAGAVAVIGCSAPAMAAGAGKVATLPGTRLWASRVAGPGDANNQASAVAVSPGGARVFVTGTFGDSVTSPFEDYETVGYDAATGKQLWASKYDGADGQDLATAIAISPDAHTVFVTGESQGSVQGHGNGFDYATVAYDAATGKQLWASRHDGAGTIDNDDYAKAIAVSPDGGTVFVTGQGSGKSSIWDYTTVAYSAATGKQKWVRSYNGSDNKADSANALAISPNGRTLFVTGSVIAGKPGTIDYGTIAYDARTGVQRWVSLYAGPNGDSTANAVRVSPDGRTVFVTGGSAPDFATIAYSAVTGARHWVSRWAGQHGSGAHAIAVSPGGGAVYVTGQAGTTAFNGSPEFVTVSYDARSGGQRWVRSYRAPGPCRNIATSVAVGPGGRTVFVSGYSTITNPEGRRPCDAGLDTVAYRAATGEQLWLQRVRAVETFTDSLAISRFSDTVFVTGGVLPHPHPGGQFATVAYGG